MSGKKHKERALRVKANPFRRPTPPGAPPGTLVADPSARETAIRVIGYGPHDSHEAAVSDPDEVRAFLEKWPVTWVSVDGLRDVDRIKKLGAIFRIHPLALEDVLKVHQRVKADQFDHQIYLVARMIETSTDAALSMDQLSMFIGDRYVVTFRERPGDGFDQVRERIRGGVGRLREKGSDYLAYALLDNIIDHYFPALDACVERIDALEDEIMGAPGRTASVRIHEVRHDLFNLRRCIAPLRETLNVLVRDPIPFIGDETRIYLRDCYDHVVQIIDHLEIYREVTSNLTDEYISALSIRLNEVMKVLTVIATIFMPLSFIVGLYGMNFKDIPELSWTHGYIFAWGLIILTTAVMLYFFWRRGWVGSGGEDGKKRESDK